ncbi:MAG: tetratricopeptide repeat protein [Sandaracinaceae bacterium]
MSDLDRPTVLVIGGRERMQKALEVALERHDLMVESAATESIVEATFAAAPDLLLLLGDATQDGGTAALSRLAGHPTAALVPVVLLLDEDHADAASLGAFRHGVVAAVKKTASADGMARRIAELAHELPERSGEVAGELGEATVDELVSLFSQQLRSGILSVSSGSPEGPSTQVVIRAGRPVEEAIRELVGRLKPLVRTQQGPLHYEFHESPDARLSLFDELGEGGDADVLSGRRVLVIEQNPARADQLVQELRNRGALVAVADGDGKGLERARAHDPDIVILDGSGVESWAMPALRQLRRDPRLRWASLLVVDASELWTDPLRPPNLERVERSVAALMKPDRDLTERVSSDKKTFETRLELVGPGRLLRALAATSKGLKVTTRHPRVRVEIDLAEGLVAGATAKNARGDEQIGEGPAALAAWLGLGSGRVRVERKDAPSTANVMAPVDDALAAAHRERSPIRPSLPPPSSASVLPSRPPAALSASVTAATAASGGNTEVLLGRLESLLGQLTSVLPPTDAASIGPPASARPSSSRSFAKPRGSVPPAEPTSSTAPHAISPRIVPPWQEVEEDEDLPVIEATAEPSTMPSSAPEPVVEVDIDADLGPAAPIPIESAPPPPPSRSIAWIAIPIALALIAVVSIGAYALFADGDPPSDPPVADGDPDGTEPPDPTTVLSERHDPRDDDAGAPTEDAGAADAGTTDASATDAGVDAGAPDAGAPDAGGEAAVAIDDGPDEVDDDDDDVDDLDDALDDTSDIAAPDDESPEARAARNELARHHIRAGNYSRNRGELRDAERHYLQVLHLQPRNPRALAGLTRVAIMRRDGTQAVRWATRLANAQPRIASIQVLLGDAHRAAGQTAQARAAWQRALELQPSNETARSRLGR